MDEVLTLLRSIEGLSGATAQAQLLGLGPGLSIGATPAPPLPGPAGPDATTASSLFEEGFVALPEAAPLAECAGLVEAIDRLTAGGLPAMFVYLFDEPWRLGEQLCARVSALVGHPYEVVEDVWAWRVTPGHGRGWPPHRGVAAPLLAREAPELINTWVALSDVEADRACMHFIPLDEDPSYPRALATLDAPLAAVRAAPLGAGSALAWNANVLHWGGACSPRAKGARVSCSFSLARADARVGLGLPSAERATNDLRARLDAVARQLVTYGKEQPDVRPAVRAWAEGTVAMQATIASLSENLHAQKSVT